MRLAVIGFSRLGCRYAREIREAMELRGHACTAWGKGKEAGAWQVGQVETSLRAWTKEQFREADALIFVGAAGIAVRAIAPYVKSKAEDPAVLCMDEQGTYVISLLSGHLGGANELAREVAALCGAVPVNTTATDAGGRFSVDDFARREHLYLDNLKLAKRISADILENRIIGLCSDFACSGELPAELSLEQRGELGISISLDDRKSPFPETLHLVPRIAALGIGCRKGTSAEQIEKLAVKVMEEHRFSMHSVGKIASMDLKASEPGLLEFCRKWGISLLTYSEEELAEISCEGGFSESEFVKAVTGVGNVCERCALKASGQGKLIQKKRAENGVTVAVALEAYEVRF